MSQTIDELLASALTSHSGDQNEAFSSELVINQAADPIKALLDERQIELSITGPFRGSAAIDLNPRSLLQPVQQRGQVYRQTAGAVCYFRAAGGWRLHFLRRRQWPRHPPEELQRIFVPFRRLPKHRNEPGSGLGLYFTKSLIKAGGKIWVESQVGQGSQFYVRLRTDRPVVPARDSVWCMGAKCF